MITKPGLAEWHVVSPAASLLAEHANFAPNAKALLLGSGLWVEYVTADDDQSAAGWIEIFSGQDLKGWTKKTGTADKIQTGFMIERATDG